MATNLQREINELHSDRPDGREGRLEIRKGALSSRTAEGFRRIGWVALVDWRSSLEPSGSILWPWESPTGTARGHVTEAKRSMHGCIGSRRH